MKVTSNTIGAPPSMKPWKERRLCDKCRKVLFYIVYHLIRTPKPSRDTQIPHHQNGRSLLASSKAGCHLCSILVGTSFLSVGKSVDEGRSALELLEACTITIKKAYTFQSTYSQYGGPPEGILELVTEIGSSNSIYVVPRRSTSIKRRFAKILNGKFNFGLPRGPLCTATGDEEALNLAGWWLHRCLKEHSECYDTTDYSRSVRPSRLLDIGTLNGDIRVIETSETNVPDFFALSYVWGTRDCVRLLKSNLKAMQQRIELDTLPKTIREAVSATRALGYRYLWVDSLCIIQDSDEDWNIESVKMGGIYRRSVLTLGALHAAGNHKGLFATRHPLYTRSFPIPGTNFEISNNTHHAFWEYENGSAPLQTRAWVVQERASALRTLYFGETGLFWECSQCQASESDVQGTIDVRNPSWKKGISTVINTPDPSIRAMALMEPWAQIRGEYSRCELTDDKDKAKAICGLTNFLSSATGFTICHGIWLDIAPMDLCWASASTGERVTEIDAPTWSWLSVKQPVKCGINQDKYFVAWQKSAELIAYPGSPEGITWRSQIRVIAEALMTRPEGCLSFLTGFQHVYLLPDDTLTLTDPKQNARKSILQQTEQGESDETNFDHRSHPYKWIPDIVVDPAITEAWFINMAHFESYDGAREGEAGIIAVNVSSSEFKRIGILKKWVFKDISQCNYMSINEGPDPRYLPPNPFQKIENVLGLVHLT